MVKFPAWLTHLGQVGKLRPFGCTHVLGGIAASLRRQLAGERSWVSPPSVKPFSAGPHCPWLRAALYNKSFAFLEPFSFLEPRQLSNSGVLAGLADPEARAGMVVPQTFANEPTINHCESDKRSEEHTSEL